MEFRRPPTGFQSRVQPLEHICPEYLTRQAQGGKRNWCASCFLQKGAFSECYRAWMRDKAMSARSPRSDIGLDRRHVRKVRQKLTQMPTGSPLRAAVVFQLPDSVAGILPLGYEYVPVAILGQRADVRHQPVSTRNSELVGDRAIEDLPSRFDSHLRILVDSKLPLGIC